MTVNEIFHDHFTASSIVLFDLRENFQRWAGISTSVCGFDLGSFAYVGCFKFSVMFRLAFCLWGVASLCSLIVHGWFWVLFHGARVMYWKSRWRRMVCWVIEWVLASSLILFFMPLGTQIGTSLRLLGFSDCFGIECCEAFVYGGVD